MIACCKAQQSYLEPCQRLYTAQPRDILAPTLQRAAREGPPEARGDRAPGNASLVRHHDNYETRRSAPNASMTTDRPPERRWHYAGS